jgi:hypothetical protein
MKLKKSSPLKLLSQSQSNFAEMILGRSSSKIVSGISEHRPRWPPQPKTAKHIFGREPSNDYFINILFLLSKWFQTRRFLWEFPIGSYVKLSSAVAAILVGVLKCRTQFWKRTTQESFQLSLVEIGSVVRRFGPSTKMAPTAELNLT